MVGAAGSSAPDTDPVRATRTPPASGRPSPPAAARRSRNRRGVAGARGGARPEQLAHPASRGTVVGRACRDSDVHRLNNQSIIGPAGSGTGFQRRFASGQPSPRRALGPARRADRRARTRIFLARQPRSAEPIPRAATTWPAEPRRAGRSPQPQAVWLSHGAGSKIYDVDGNEYVDMHGGYGASMAGHAHPAIVAAVRTASARHPLRATDRGRDRGRRRARAERFGLPLWRFGNSGTEATMDAVHLMRAAHRPRPDHQGRGLLPRPPRLGQVSVLPEADELGRASARSASPATPGSRRRSATWSSSCRSTTSARSSAH